MIQNQADRAPLDADDILALNRAGPGIALERARAVELAAELAQLQAAASLARRHTAFNLDPSDFQSALAAVEKGA